MSNLEKINVLTKEKLDSLDLTQYKNQLFGTTDDTEDKAIAFAESERQKSKNLFDKDNVAIYNAYINAERGLVYAANTRTVAIKIKPNTTYTVSKIKSSRFIIATSVLDPNAMNSSTDVAVTQFISGYDNTSLTITSGSTDKYLFMFCYHVDADTVSLEEVLNSLQVEEGAEATDYQPYNGTITHNGDAPVVFAESERQKSKNLLETNNFSGTLRWQEYLRVPLSAGTYTISGLVNSSDTDATNCLVNFMNTLGDPILGITLNRDNQTSKTFTLTEECILINFYASNDYNNSSGDTFKYKNMQIEKGEVATDYQPYGGGELTRDKDLYDVASKRELVYQHQGNGVVDITNSTLDTLQQYCSLFDLNPDKTYKAFKEPSTNPKIFEILGTPPRYSSYAYFRIKMYCEGVINSGKMYHPYRVYKVFAMSTSGALGEKYIVSDQSNTYVQGQWNELV